MLKVPNLHLEPKMSANLPSLDKSTLIGCTHEMLCNIVQRLSQVINRKRIFKRSLLYWIKMLHNIDRIFFKKLIEYIICLLGIEGMSTKFYFIFVIAVKSDGYTILSIVALP